MMKLRYFTLSMAFVMAVALTGCSANRDNGNVESNYPNPTQSAASDHNGRASAGMDDGAYYSDNMGGAQESVPGTDHGPSASGGVIDDIGDAAGDVARGAGDMARDAGNAIGHPAGDVGRAMR